MIQKSVIKLSLIGLIMSASLSGCSTAQPAEIDSKLTAWQGAEIETLIQTWGLPTGEQQVNDLTYAEWNTRDIKNKPSMRVGVGGFGGNFFGSIGTTLFGGREEVHCRVQVGYNQEGRVVTTNWAGDPEACDSAIPERES